MTVRRLIGAARANGLDAAGLRDSAERSKKSFLPLLQPVTSSEAEINADLANALSEAILRIPTEPSSTAKGSVELIKRAQATSFHHQPLIWPTWAALTKVKCAKKDGQSFIEALAEVAGAAARHPEHPALHQDCSDFIDTLFACAADALDAYQTFKAERGLLDFVDQEALTLEVLNDDALAAKLGEKISRVFVDEFQDSSPLQIAIFTAMARLVDQSTWVGDPKQAIYGFRNADCELTQAAFNGVAQLSDAPQDVLAKSYRSRLGIVELVNAAFEPAFAAMGLDTKDHTFSGTARSEVGFKHAPFAVWWLDGTVPAQYAGLAAGIREALEQREEWSVDTRAGSTRGLKPSDIAILCRAKTDITKLAAELSRLGVKVAVERDGLSRTPHVELVIASLRWVADPSDRLALAELARFFSDDPSSDLWLRAASAEDPDAALKDAVPTSSALIALREGSIALTPAEMLDAVLVLPEVTRRIEGWGNYSSRLEDLEAIRGFAITFESLCASSGVPATVSGLLLALSEDDPKRPRSMDADAVQVMTYHGAKGLEWPLVVLTGLNREPKPRLFEAVAVVDGELDWRNPLANRWIRFWPWPYGGQSANVGLDDTARSSEVGLRAAMDTAFLALSSADNFTLRDATNGVHIFGGIGGGKTSSAKHLRAALRRAGCGMLILAVKPEGKEMWLKEAAEAGRSNSVILFGDAGHCYNPIDHQMAQQGMEGCGTVVSTIMCVVDATRRAVGETGNGGSAFWDDSMRAYLGHVVPMVYPCC